MEADIDEGYKSQTYKEYKAKKMAFAVRPETIALTTKPKYLYPQFNFYELEVNRLASLPEYKALAGEITAFNQELDDWKRKNIEIRNLFVTYHLYQNLYSRMKYTSSLIIDRAEAKRAFSQILKWFLEEKPKIRNKVPEKEEGKMKPSTADRETDCQIDSLLTTTKTKRELKVYEAMSRTAHSDLFPPKERLLDYKRKEIVQGIAHEPRLQRRALSHNSFGKIQKYSGSFASTMTSFKHAVVTELKREQSKIQPIVVPFELKTPEQKRQEGKGVQEGAQLKVVREEDIQDMERERQVVQEELMQQNIVQVLHEEDLPDGEEDVLEEQDKAGLKYKKYREDPNADQQTIAEENIKDTRQSTLRRILKQKEQAIRCKMEQLNIANQMLNWGAVKGRTNSEAHMRSERRQLVNRYTQMQFVPKTFEQRQSARKRDIPEYPMLYRSKSSHGGTIEREVERFKINSALKTYGRYINHVEIKPVALETAELNEQMRIMRATSLTSFAHQTKRTPFSQTIQAHAAQNHNDAAEDYVQFAKERLAKKGIGVEKRSLLSALVVADTARMDKHDAFPPQSKLFSNPFFPKHLYQTKPKKKKK